MTFTNTTWLMNKYGIVTVISDKPADSMRKLSLSQPQHLLRAIKTQWNHVIHHLYEEKMNNFMVETDRYLIRLWAFLQKDIILLISRARVALVPPCPALRVPSSILDRKSFEKGLPTLLWFPSWNTHIQWDDGGNSMKWKCASDASRLNSETSPYEVIWKTSTLGYLRRCRGRFHGDNCTDSPLGHDVDLETVVDTEYKLCLSTNHNN